MKLKEILSVLVTAEFCLAITLLLWAFLSLKQSYEVGMLDLFFLYPLCLGCALLGSGLTLSLLQLFYEIKKMVSEQP